MEPLALAVTVVANVAGLALLITVIVLLVRRGHRRRTSVAYEFIGAPVLPATVVERRHLGWGVNSRYAYRVVYRVEPPGAAPFTAEEQRMMTTMWEAPKFKVGTNLSVAVRADLGTVQAVPGSQR